MISMNELLGKAKFETLSKSIQTNLQVLLDRINRIRVIWGKPMIVTSGLRTMEDHLRIYKDKGITDSTKIPMRSNHLFGRAVDIFDPQLLLTTWLKLNPKQLEDAQLWCEDNTPTWVHFQIVAPCSGKRWFKP